MAASSARGGVVVMIAAGVVSGIIMAVLVAFLTSLSLGAVVPSESLDLAVAFVLIALVGASCIVGGRFPVAALSSGVSLVIIGLLGLMLASSSLGADQGFFPMMQFGLRTFLIPAVGGAHIGLYLSDRLRRRSRAEHARADAN